MATQVGPPSDQSRQPQRATQCSPGQPRGHSDISLKRIKFTNLAHLALRGLLGSVVSYKVGGMEHQPVCSGLRELCRLGTIRDVTTPLLERPRMAVRTKTPGGCGKVARLALPKVTPPATTESAPKLPTKLRRTGRTVTPGAEIQPNFDPKLPETCQMWARIGQI